MNGMKAPKSKNWSCFESFRRITLVVVGRDNFERCHMLPGSALQDQMKFQILHGYESSLELGM